VEGEVDGSDNQKLSHICIFGNCQKGKKNGEEYCRIHNSSSIEEDGITISKVAGNSGLIFVIGFFVIFIYQIVAPSKNSAGYGLEGLDNLILLFWAFVSLCLGIVFLLIAGVSKKIESQQKK
jgi:hypothetical protein